MPSGADLAYQRMLRKAGLDSAQTVGIDGARLEQLIQLRESKVTDVGVLGDFFKPMSKVQYPVTNFVTNLAPVISASAPVGKTFVDAGTAKVVNNGTKTVFSAGYYSNNTTSVFGSLPHSVWEFMHSGVDLTLRLFHVIASQPWNVYVDDQPVFSTYQVPGAPAIEYVPLNFDTFEPRKITIVACGSLVFGGMYTAANEDIMEPPRRLRMCLFGDSYTGRINNVTYDAPAWVIFMLTGFLVFEMAQGGTGYLNDAAGAGGRTPYGNDERTNRWNSYDLDACIILGSINDVGYVTSIDGSPLKNAALAFYNKLAELRPYVSLIVLGAEPYTPFDSTRPATYSVANTAVKEAALLAPNVIEFIDWYNENWMTGNGCAGATNGSGSQDYYVGADGLHLNSVGVLSLFTRLVTRIAKVPYNLYVR